MQVLKIQTYLYDKMHHTKIFKKYFTFDMLAILRDTLTRRSKKKKSIFFNGLKKSKTRKTFSKQFFKTKKTYYKHV